MKKILGYAVVILLIIMQFFPIDKTNPPVNPRLDFLTIKQTPPQIAGFVKTACYDCHSNETLYPWYAGIAPVSWFLKNHIDEGRKRLNFSEWAAYEKRAQIKKLKAAAENIQQAEMPLESYILVHKNAKLTEQQRFMLSDYFKKMSSETENLLKYGF